VRREYIGKEFTMQRASGLRILYADEKIGCDFSDPTTRRHQLWATRIDKHTTSLRAPFFWPLEGSRYHIVTCECGNEYRLHCSVARY
jgi:hypothetical protein